MSPCEQVKITKQASAAFMQGGAVQVGEGYGTSLEEHGGSPSVPLPTSHWSARQILQETAGLGVELELHKEVMRCFACRLWCGNLSAEGCLTIT